MFFAGIEKSTQQRITVKYIEEKNLNNARSGYHLEIRAMTSH